MSEEKSIRNLEAPSEPPGLIVFDHECVFCSGFVKFVFSRDPRHVFNFAAAQSKIGQELCKQYGLDEKDFTTNLVILDGKLHTKMDAFITVMAALGGPLKLFLVLKVLPERGANWLYDRIAKNRYRIWGRYETCMIPSKELQARVVE